MYSHIVNDLAEADFRLKTWSFFPLLFLNGSHSTKQKSFNEIQFSYFLNLEDKWDLGEGYCIADDTENVIKDDTNGDVTRDNLDHAVDYNEIFTAASTFNLNLLSSNRERSA